MAAMTAARSFLATVASGILIGALGLAPGAAGALDARTLLGWLALVAPAAGAYLGPRATAPALALVVAVWGLGWSFLAGPEAGVWPPCVLAGFFATGVASGRRAGPGAAGGLLFTTLVLSGLPLGFLWLPGGAEFAPRAPRLAAFLLDLSPLVLVFDTAGHDWLHAQPEVYARSGIEWFPRRPWSGNLAGPTLLVVGCLLAVLVRPAREAPGAPA
jgi:hypothetical protein